MSKVPFAESYTGRLRAKIGKDLIFMPSVCAVIENTRHEILMIRRADDGQWALPGGIPEVGDSVLDCVKREVFEETGITMLTFRPFAFSSRAEIEIHTYPNGDQQHAYRMLFYCNDYRGEARINDDEATDVRFFALGKMPPSKDILRPDWHALKLLVDFKKTDRFVCE
jgi:ADP-ribose pyrophosphatase YjhB (NUDIX family)